MACIFPRGAEAMIEPVAQPNDRSEVARVLKATEAALCVFGSPAKALRWLSKPNWALEGRIPGEVAAESEAGMQEVIEETDRVGHGIYL